MTVGQTLRRAGLSMSSLLSGERQKGGDQHTVNNRSRLARAGDADRHPEVFSGKVVEIVDEGALTLLVEET